MDTYNPKKLLVTFNGVPLGGFADGTFLNIERTGDSYTKVTGAGGETARAKSNDRSGTTTLTLMQSSPSNDVLSAAMVLDELSDSGAGALMIKELDGSTVIFSGSAWIRKPPAVVYSKGIENREWVFDMADQDVFVGSYS